MTLPPEAQKVINARANDAIIEIWRAVNGGDRPRLERAARDLVAVLEDEEALSKEHGS